MRVMLTQMNLRPALWASYCTRSGKVPWTRALGRMLAASLAAGACAGHLPAAERADGPAAADRAAAGGTVVHPNLWPRAAPALKPDPALEARVSELLGGLTLEQKVGQLIQPDIASIAPADLHQFAPGSILNGGNSSPDGDEFAPPRKWLELADRFYDASVDPSHGPHPIPTMWGVDAVHGHNNIVGATIFPHNIGLGATRDPKLLRRIGEITAVEVRATGLDWSFGPTLAVVQDIRWGRSYESYSENPDLVREYASAILLGLQGVPGTPSFLDASHVLATPKHFVGDGGTGGRDQGDNLASEEELRDIHARGYPAAITAGAQTIMASFSSWHGVKLSADKELLTDVLKERMGFDGFVVGDWNAHGQVPGCTKFNCPAVINAGMDMFMAPDSWRELYANTLAQARSGVIPETRLNDAVRRILRVKVRAHLFEEGRPSSRPLAGRFDLLGSPEHRAVAREAVRESLVLLKNAHHLLPLSPHAHVLVAGDGADDVAKQCGGWTITWQGTGVANKDFPHGESIFSGIRTAVTSAGGTAELAVTGDFQVRPDVAIVVFGENPYAEFQGDIPTAEYSPGAKPDLALLKKLRARGIPVVSVFLSGRPLWVNPEINASDAFVAAWLPGSEGGGIADVLFRKPGGEVRYDFHGKLSFSWPRTPQQTMAIRSPADGSALFPYGYGLRYHDNGELKALPEDSGAVGVAAVDTRVFFTAGRATTGWRWAAGEGGVGVTGADKSAQEDARALRWTGVGAAWTGIAGDSPIDLQREANGQLSLALDYRVDAPVSAKVALRVGCGAGCGGSVAIDRALALAQTGQWTHLKVPLICFAQAGADLGHVTLPFAVESADHTAISVANIRLESGTDNVMACP